jgi:hypothetical protein
MSPGSREYSTGLSRWLRVTAKSLIDWPFGRLTRRLKARDLLIPIYGDSKLAMEYRAGWSGLDYGDYSGDLVTLEAIPEYRLTSNFGVSIGYNYIDTDLTVDQTRRTDKYSVDMDGPVLYLSAGF